MIHILYLGNPKMLWQTLRGTPFTSSTTDAVPSVTLPQKGRQDNVAKLP